MCVSAGNSILFYQVRYEHSHQIRTKVMIPLVLQLSFFFFLSKLPVTQGFGAMWQKE